MKNELCQRLFEFAVNTIKTVKQLALTPENKIIQYQIVKSSTSSGANYEEAQAGASKADFINKVTIALKEMRESNYWLRILLATTESDELLITRLKALEKESEELKKILGKIVVSSRRLNH